MTGSAPAIGLAGIALILAASGLAWRLHRQRAETSRLRERLEDALENLQRLQHAFARFAPHDVVEEIARGEPGRGVRKEVTILFADLVGFTRLSGTVEPAVLVRMLNGYFERMSRAIAEHRGHVAALVGDGIFALFGALEHDPWQSDGAAHAALAMRTGIAAYNEELAAEGLPALALGIGLHRGAGVAGLVGSPELMTYAFVGRAVNLAARVQDLTRVHGVDVLITEAVRRAIDPRFAVRALPPREVRGVSEPVATFALEGFDLRP